MDVYHFIILSKTSKAIVYINKNINFVDNKGNYLLHIAALYHNIKVSKALLKKGG